MTGAGGQRPQRKDRSSVQSAFQQVPVSGKEREPQLAQEEELDLHPGPRPPAHPRVVWCLEWPEVEGGSGLPPRRAQPRSAAAPLSLGLPACGPGIPQGSGWRLPARTQKCLCPRGLLPLLSLLTSEPLVLEQTPQGLPRAGRIRFQRRLWGVGGAYLSSRPLPSVLEPLTAESASQFSARFRARRQPAPCPGASASRPLERRRPGLTRCRPLWPLRAGPCRAGPSCPAARRCSQTRRGGASRVGSLVCGLGTLPRDTAVLSSLALGPGLLGRRALFCIGLCPLLLSLFGDLWFERLRG